MPERLAQEVHGAAPPARTSFVDAWLTDESEGTHPAPSGAFLHNAMRRDRHRETKGSSIGKHHDHSPVVGVEPVRSEQLAEWLACGDEEIRGQGERADLGFAVQPGQQHTQAVESEVDACEGQPGKTQDFM